MLSSENYYKIIDYGVPTWNRIQSYKTSREILLEPTFLSAQHCCLIGEKGVGKTVIACQKALQLAQGDTKKIFYISLDDTFFSQDGMYDLAKLAQDSGIKVVVFDEVHRYPQWKSELKRIIDRLDINCIISGSSILSFNDLGGLARRIVKYELQGLSLREYINLSFGISLPRLSLAQVISNSKDKLMNLKTSVELATSQPILALYQSYLQRGYYAYSLSKLSLEDFLKTLRQATEDTIAYEIVLNQTHSRPDMARKLQSLFKAIAHNVPYTVDYENLKTYADIGDLRTLKHYLGCLQQAGIIRSIDKKTLKNLRKPEKIYLGNCCLYYAYADLNPNIGSVRENFFINCMRLAGLDVIAHSGQADFSVDSLVFEIGGSNKGKKQIAAEKQAYIVQETADVSNDPQKLPLWAFGFL
ncbi:MAG: AAA family ATPase [Proteobacteria bacterium]|nr:AAA family ATPase [Pseudomonadota bacterium]